MFYLKYRPHTLQEPVSYTHLLVLSLLVIIHELGHYVVAKLNGIKVEEFGFGIPPRVFGFRIGETLYSLNLLPFGGFVKVYGEELAEVEDSKICLLYTSRCV